MYIAINKCYGGFRVTKEVYDELGLEWNGFGSLSNEDFGIESDNYEAYRIHPKLINAIKKIGEEASSNRYSEIAIVEIPDDIDWEIYEYDGMETIHEKHRKWG